MPDIEVDFRNSYLNWLTASGSYGRFLIDAVCTVNGTDYSLGSSVFACSMYAENNLIQYPPYLYQAAFSDSDYQLLRSAEMAEMPNTTGKLDDKRFKEVDVKLIRSGVVRVDTLTVLDAIKEGALFMATTEFTTSDGVDCIIRYPVKHINYDQQLTMIQVETGPVIIPSDKDYRLKVGYLAFNKMDNIEFMLRNESKQQADSFYKGESCVCNTKLYKYTS